MHDPTLQKEGVGDETSRFWTTKATTAEVTGRGTSSQEVGGMVLCHQGSEAGQGSPQRLPQRLPIQILSKTGGEQGPP